MRSRLLSHEHMFADAADEFSAPGETRTHSLRVKSALLSPVELRGPTSILALGPADWKLAARLRRGGRAPARAGATTYTGLRGNL